MAWNPDTSYGGDHALRDYIETVVFEVRDAAGIATASVQAAKGERLDIREAQQSFGSSIQLTARDTTWRLWDSTLDGNEPQAGDTITNGTDVYGILEVVKQRPGPTWDCQTRKQI